MFELEPEISSEYYEIFKENFKYAKTHKYQLCRSADGRIVPIKDLEDEHLVKILKRYEASVVDGELKAAFVMHLTRALVILHEAGMISEYDDLVMLLEDICNKHHKDRFVPKIVTRLREEAASRRSNMSAKERWRIKNLIPSLDAFLSRFS